MNDRLGDLAAWTSGNDDEDDPYNQSAATGSKDVEMGAVGKNNKQPKHMGHFFREVESIKADIEFIKQATSRIGLINQQAMQATTTKEEKELSRQLKPLLDQANKRAKQAKAILGLLKDETKRLQGACAIIQSDRRIRENLCNTLTRKFIDEMKAYQSAQQKYKSDIKKKVTRQVQIVKPDATEDEVDAVMHSEGGSDGYVMQTMLTSRGMNDQVKTTYAKSAGKYQDVLALEHSMAELHQMFLDFALLTEHQGELLDQIEFQTKQAGEHVEEGNFTLADANESQRQIRKKRCWIMLIVLVVMAVLVLIIFP